ncbi:hypothetical protein BKA69DRAFT_1036783 [Paraphysoderma sedebokerense]|nr:hypothetical protein BKA69DRAFT_1036783 [Paraphysoderma sedebokerense]
MEQIAADISQKCHHMEAQYISMIRESTEPPQLLESTSPYMQPDDTIVPTSVAPLNPENQDNPQYHHRTTKVHRQISKVLPLPDRWLQDPSGRWYFTVPAPTSPSSDEATTSSTSKPSPETIKKITFHDIENFVLTPTKQSRMRDLEEVARYLKLESEEADTIVSVLRKLAVESGVTLDGSRYQKVAGDFERRGFEAEA